MAAALLVAALVLFLLAWLLLWMARRSREKGGLPRGRVVYVDSRDWRRPDAPLRSERYGLVGRPDYLVQRGRTVIPVEVKPSRTGAEPYQADLLQLAAYCLLVEETSGRMPPYGLLRYRDRTFEVPYGAGVRRRLLELLAEMRAAGRGGEVGRSHEQRARCAACGMRGHCGEEALC